MTCHGLHPKFGCSFGVVPDCPIPSLHLHLRTELKDLGKEWLCFVKRVGFYY